MTTAEYWELGCCPILKTDVITKKLEPQKLRAINTFDVIKMVKTDHDSLCQFSLNDLLLLEK